jgi:hypothetical protein
MEIETGTLENEYKGKKMMDSEEEKNVQNRCGSRS